MKGIPIIFRYETEDGKYFYVPFKEPSLFNGIPVKPDSTAQLVGYDADGKEIYEGDEIIRNDADEYSHNFKGKILAAFNQSFHIDWNGKIPKNCLSLEQQVENDTAFFKKFKN